MTNRFSHPYHLDEFIFILLDIGKNLIFISCFDKNHVSKHDSPRWDAPFGGSSSGAISMSH